MNPKTTEPDTLPATAPHDQLGRTMRDLRISLIDQCNMRCRYCMPEERFGRNYPFLKQRELLSFDAILRIIRAAETLGVEKVRLTGGEPLLRRKLDILIARIAAETGVRDIALTTNGLLLADRVRDLKRAGLQRVNLSLDALDAATFSRMSGGYGDPERVLAALDASIDAGVKVKINSVIRRNVNDDQILPLLKLAMQRGVEVRFIEYMDVGASNGWQRSQVFSESEILERITTEMGPVRALPCEWSAVARRYELESHANCRWGVIASITRPFCGGCVRARISADGKLYTCLFSDHGTDLRPSLAPDQAPDAVIDTLREVWLQRSDRYSEQRDAARTETTSPAHRVEMSYIGG